MYLPRIPMVKSWIPPRKRMTAIREVQPDVELPKMRVRTTTKKVISREIKQDSRPAAKAIIKGKSEKLTIPSME